MSAATMKSRTPCSSALRLQFRAERLVEAVGEVGGRDAERELHEGFRSQLLLELFHEPRIDLDLSTRPLAFFILSYTAWTSGGTCSRSRYGSLAAIMSSSDRDLTGIPSRIGQPCSSPLIAVSPRSCRRRR